MKNSIIINIFYRIIVTIIKSYKFSYTNRVINKISLTLKRYYSNSGINRILTKNTTGKNTKHSFIIHIFEKLLQNIIKGLNSLITKGIDGSFFFKLIGNLENIAKNNKLSFITHMIIGFTVVYNVIYILKGTTNLQLIIVSIIVVALSVLANYFDIKIGMKNSYILNSLTRIFRTEFEE